MANSKKSNGSRAKKSSLKKIREQLAPYFEKANLRASRLGGETKATVVAAGTLSGAGERHYKETGELFNINALHYKELQREFTRVKEFLNDETSLPRTETETRQAENRAKYGSVVDRSFYAVYGVNYDMSKLSEEQAKQLFSAYRRLEESNAPVLQGKSGYGSDNLINDLLDVMIGGSDVPSWLPPEAAIEIMVDKGQSYLNQYQKDRDKMALREMESGNEDYGRFEDFDNISREEFERRHMI